LSLIMSRFAAAKAIGLLGGTKDLAMLKEIAKSDADPRLQLEALGALLRLGHQPATEALVAYFDSPPREDLRMEAALVAGEVRNALAREALLTMLGHSAVAEQEELRAAIVWNLGALAHGDLGALVPHLGDASDLVAAHAAVGMGRKLTEPLRERLFEILRKPDLRASASAAWVLTRDEADVVGSLVDLAERDPIARGWAISILGRRSPEEVTPLLHGNPDLLALVSPWWVVAPSRNWTSTPAGAQLLDELRRQVLVQGI
jgi:HEAT repeat protein